MTTALEGEVSKDLAFINRNVQSSLEVLPGVVQDTTSRLQGGIMVAVNGGQAPEHAGYVDGVDTSFAKQGGATRIFLPITSLTEIKMDTVGFSAEYGRVVGGVTSSVIKSGTNQFHGDFLYIPQNEKWKASYDELDIPRDDEIIDSYETSIGGPIVRDKAWFFASYGELNTNEADVVGDGIPLNVGFETTASILKLNFQPTSRHQLQLSGVDAPMDKVNINQNFGDEFTPCDCNLEENLATLTWSFAISDSLFLESKVATQEDSTFREPLTLRVLTPGASPDSPLGNHFRYQDQAEPAALQLARPGSGAGLHRNRARPGQCVAELVPRRARDQVRRRLPGRRIHDPQRHRHVATVGPDTTPTSPAGSRRLVTSGCSIRPRRSRPLPRSCRPSPRIASISATASTSTSACAWTTRRSTTTPGPRCTRRPTSRPGWRRPMTSAVRGRCSSRPPRAATSRSPVRTSSTRTTRPSRTAPTCSRRSSGTRRRSATTAHSGALNLPPGFNPGTFDPYYKDEASLGLEWQFVPAWAFEVRGSMWEETDAYWVSQQFNAAGVIVRDVRNWDDAFREYEGVVFELNRAFRDNWTLRTNYTWGETEGNHFGNNEVALFQDSLFEGLGGLEVCTAASYVGCRAGSTDATIRNREGIGNTGREHILNIVGLKVFPIGEHSIGLGGYFGFRSGERWGLRAPTSVRSSGFGARPSRRPPTSSNVERSSSKTP